MRPSSRLGQAYLSPRGLLYLVVSDPWIHHECGWQHSMVAIDAGSFHSFCRDEDFIAEMTTRPDWTRLT